MPRPILVSDHTSSARPLFHRVIYRLVRAAAYVVATVLFRAKVEGREHIPKTGGALICSNHQSYLDPFLIGMAFERPVCFVARQTLSDNWILRPLMRWFDTIPIDREGTGTAGLRAVVRRTMEGECVLIFPEGTRTKDGFVGQIQPGFSIVARRTNVPILPVAVDGAFDALPRAKSMVRISKVAVCIGEPIDVETVSSMRKEALVAELSRRLKDCHARAREMRLGHRTPDSGDTQPDT